MSANLPAGQGPGLRRTTSEQEMSPFGEDDDDPLNLPTNTDLETSMETERRDTMSEEDGREALETSSEREMIRAHSAR